MNTSKLITKRQVIAGVLKKWRTQYDADKWPHKQDITKKLEAMDLSKASEKDVAAVIGNNSWTTMVCDQCKKSSDVLVAVGEAPDYESRTANLCPECVRAAFNLLPK